MNFKYILLTAFACLSVMAVSAAPVDSVFTIDGAKGKLAAHLQLPDIKDGEECPIVVMCHGFGGNMGGPLFRYYCIGFA